VRRGHVQLPVAAHRRLGALPRRLHERACVAAAFAAVRGCQDAKSKPLQRCRDVGTHRSSAPDPHRASARPPRLIVAHLLRYAILNEGATPDEGGAPRRAARAACNWHARWPPWRPRRGAHARQRCVRVRVGRLSLRRGGHQATWRGKGAAMESTCVLLARGCGDRLAHAGTRRAVSKLKGAHRLLKARLQSARHVLWSHADRSDAPGSNL
jgi:hypothetical protein